MSPYETLTVAAAAPPPSPARQWVRSFGLLALRDSIELRPHLQMILILQVIFGVGSVVLYGFVTGRVDVERATFYATGAPVLALLPTGLALVPATVARQKATQVYDYLWTLPVPRTAAALSMFVVFSVAILPGSVLSLVLASVIFDAAVSVSWLVVPAVALAAGACAAFGYALGHAIQNPRTTGLISNFGVLLAMLYSPISFPIEQFPTWLQQVHLVLPIHHMAVVVRGGLTDGLVDGATYAVSLAYLAAWTAVSWLVVVRVISSRD